jgi:hypothetical protein
MVKSEIMAKYSESKIIYQNFIEYFQTKRVEKYAWDCSQGSKESWIGSIGHVFMLTLMSEKNCSFRSLRLLAIMQRF